jgi:hypothetical protein
MSDGRRELDLWHDRRRPGTDAAGDAGSHPAILAVWILLVLFAAFFSGFVDDHELRPQL